MSEESTTKLTTLPKFDGKKEKFNTFFIKFESYAYLNGFKKYFHQLIPSDFQMTRSFYDFLRQR